MGIEFDGFYYNSLADLTAHLEGLKGQEREDALAVLNAQKNTGLLETTSPELGMTSEDPDYIIDPDTGAITTTEELASQFDSSDFDYEDDVELDLGLDPVAPEVIVGPDSVQFDFTDVEVEPEFEFDEQWIEDEATAKANLEKAEFDAARIEAAAIAYGEQQAQDNNDAIEGYLDKAESEVILGAPQGYYSGDEGQVVQEATDTAISSAENALTLAEETGTQEQKDRAQELLDRAKEQQSNQIILGEPIEDAPLEEDADAVFAEMDAEMAGEVTVTGQDLWANGAKDKDATYYVDEEGGYHKVLADGEEETLSEKQIGQIQAKVTAGATLPDWTQPQDPQADYPEPSQESYLPDSVKQAIADEENALAMAQKLNAMGAPELLDALKAEQAAEEAAETARENAEGRLAVEAAFAANETLGDGDSILSEYYVDGELATGEALDTYQELDIALAEARAQKEEIETFLAEEVSEGIDLDGDGIDDETISGTQEENLEGTEQGQLLDEQLEALTQLEEDLLERAGMPEASLEKMKDLEKALTTAGGDPEAKAMQSFWTNASKYDPKAQFRFKVIIGGGDAQASVDATTGATKGAVGMALQDALGKKGSDNPTDDPYNDIPDDTNGSVWYAKSVDKPTIQFAKFAEGFHIMGNFVSQVEPLVEIPTFPPINMTLIDPSYPNATRKLLRWLRRSGYNDTQAKNTNDLLDITPNMAFMASIGDVQIQQLDSDGKVLEIWWLQEAYPAEINFGKLDYSSTDFVEIGITWVFKSVMVQMMAHGAEEEFKYFQNYVAPKRPGAGEARSCGDRYLEETKGTEPWADWISGLDDSDKCAKAAAAAVAEAVTPETETNN